MEVSKRALFSIWYDEKTSTKKLLAVENYVFNNIIDKTKYNVEQCRNIKQILSSFVSNLGKKWKKCNYTLLNFEQRNRGWLDSKIVLLAPEDNNNLGRHVKNFAECSSKTKVKKVSQLVSKSSCDELVVAARVSLQKAGKRSASKVVSLLESDSNIAKKIKENTVSKNNNVTPYSADEALALYVDGDYTKHSYKLMQSGAKIRNANIYPSYDALQLAKKKCYPTGVQVTETSAEVPLQNLVDHTVSRIVESQKEVFKNLSEKQITAIYKWGCDGSSGHSTYCQSFSDPELNKTDENSFLICIVPLQVKTENAILWENSRPSSTRFCRPIKLIYKKETSELVTKEFENIKQQILEINPTTFEDFEIRHEFYMTMIDGKIFSIISESSSQTCGICGATPKIMNNLNAIKNQPIKANMYEYGLSTLHAWIRCFECILHIAYRLPIKKWQVRGADKSVLQETKLKIQQKLRTEMGLLVDIPKPGSGNTNNGNTARKFFKQPKLAALLTGVSEEIISRFSVILRTMACGYKVNTHAFKMYCWQTAEIFVEMYPWFYMPSSVHKILLHGADIINNISLPIGMMSEEAQESRNKDLRNFREYHTRKNSRKNTMEDLINSLFLTSDPLISSISKQPHAYSRNAVQIDRDVQNLISELITEEDGDVSDSD